MNFQSIVLSGNPVSGKSTLAKELQKEYGWPVHSLGGLWRAKYEEMHPKHEITFEQFYSKSSPQDSIDMNMQAKVMFENGNYIGESRLVSYLDQERCLLVYVTAALDIRAQRAISGREEYRGKTIDQIRHILFNREYDEVKVGIQLFNVDYRDPRGYHIVLNSGLLTVKQEFEAVKSLMDAKRSQ